MTDTDRFIYKASPEITALAASFSDFQYKMHYHEEYALGVTLRGIQQYNLGGSLQSSYRNGVMLFNPEQAHDGRSYDKAGIDYVMLYIKPELFAEALGKEDGVRFSAPIVYNYRLERSILNLTNAIFGGRDEALRSELLVELADSFTPPDLSAAHPQDDALTRRAKQMIRDSLGKVLSLDDLSGEFGMSKFRFIRAFKAGAGVSPYQYFLNCKVERAKQLIETTRDVYAAVAEYGFVDLTHLNRHFKSIYGTTALEYLAHLKEL